MDQYEKIDNLFQRVREIKSSLIEDMDRMDSGREMSLQIPEYEAAIRLFAEKGFNGDWDKERANVEILPMEARLKNMKNVLIVFCIR